jgi:hypothetical protein
MTTILFEEGSLLKENANEYDWQSEKLARILIFEMHITT